MGGWARNSCDKGLQNSEFRENIIKSYDFDIFCCAETFWKDNDHFQIDGYKCVFKNRKVSTNARRGSGGVCVFLKKSFIRNYTYEILDDSVEDMLWLKLCDSNDDAFVISACYLPPKDSTRASDSEAFFTKLLEQVYTYQNIGPVYILGDFNARCGDLTDYVEGVDEIIGREVIDNVTNDHGHHLIDFLFDTCFCLVNGRVGTQNFTCVSGRGKSVVDYLLLPQEQLQTVSIFNIRLMSEVSNTMNMNDIDRIPDHSLLDFQIKLTNRTPSTVKSEVNSDSRAPRYNTKHIPGDFMNDATSRIKLLDTIYSIEHSLQLSSDANKAYDEFVTLIRSEMEDKLPKNFINKKSDRAASFLRRKPYWNPELKFLVEKRNESERHWLKCTGPARVKRALRTEYLSDRNVFDKALRREKRCYQKLKQDELLNLCNNSPKDFWKKIGKLGMHSDRSKCFPDEVKSVDGSTINVTDSSQYLQVWHDAFKNLYTIPMSDDGSVDINAALGPSMNIDCSLLNVPISRKEVEDSVYRAKLNKAVGIDEIQSAVLRNPGCIDILHTIIKHCFTFGKVPGIWGHSIINPILKAGKDPLDPLSYRGISLISIPCKVYADVLNQRLSKWLESNDILVDEQNGFRKNRGCIEHQYVLYSLINNRKIKKQSTFVCFVDMKKAFDSVNRELNILA